MSHTLVNHLTRMTWTVLLVFPATLVAADQVDEAIGDLANDNSQRRDEAESLLSFGDISDLTRCREALAISTDAEAKTRLGRICSTLESRTWIRKASIAWKDRWFLYESGEGDRKWEHCKAEMCDIAGRKAWQFTLQSFIRPREGVESTMSHVIRTREEDGLPLVDMEYSIDIDNDKARGKCVFDSKGVVSLDSTGIEKSRARWPIEPIEAARATHIGILEYALEVSSLRRVKSVDVPLVSILGFRDGELDSEIPVTTAHCCFSGNSEVAANGKTCQLRIYTARLDGCSGSLQFEIDDNEGLYRLRAIPSEVGELPEMLRGLTVTRVSEADIRALCDK